jgi:hypothetical protein
VDPSKTSCCELEAAMPCFRSGQEWTLGLLHGMTKIDNHFGI